MVRYLDVLPSIVTLTPQLLQFEDLRVSMGVGQGQSHWTMWCVVEVNPTYSAVSTIQSLSTTVSTMKMWLSYVEVSLSDS